MHEMPAPAQSIAQKQPDHVMQPVLTFYGLKGYSLFLIQQFIRNDDRF